MKARAKAPGERRGKAPRKQLATKAAKRHAPAASAAAKPKESDDATLEQQRTQLELQRAYKLPAKELFPYGKKAIVDAPKNKASIENIVSGATRLTFTPSGMACTMTVHTEGAPVSFAKGTIWVPANPAQLFDVCQNQIQADALDGSGELSATFYCGNLSLPCPSGIAFMPTGYSLKDSSNQRAVWALTDGPASKKLTREQALQKRLKSLPKVLGSGGTTTLAKVTAVSGRWLEVQASGVLSDAVATLPQGWAHAFLERGPWRGNTKLSTLPKMYDVVLDVTQYFVPDGGNGDGGFWVLADVTGSIKKADLVGTWLTVAFLPSMGLPKLPIRATTPPKDVVNALGAEVLASLAAAAPKPEEASSSQAAGEYWEVQDGAKRVKKAPKAAMHSGHTML